MDSALARLRRLLGRIAGPGVDLVVECEDGLPPVRFDAGAFRLLVIELVRAACESMDDEGRIAVRATAGPGCVRLTVADTGPSGAVEALPRPSDPFHVVPGRGASAEAGLTAVHDLVASKGATIEVVATPGGGSKFSVYLPLAV